MTYDVEILTTASDGSRGFRTDCTTSKRYYASTRRRELVYRGDSVRVTDRYGQPLPPDDAATQGSRARTAPPYIAP